MNSGRAWLGGWVWLRCAEVAGRSCSLHRLFRASSQHGCLRTVRLLTGQLRTPSQWPRRTLSGLLLPILRSHTALLLPWTQAFAQGSGIDSLSWREEGHQKSSGCEIIIATLLEVLVCLLLLLSHLAKGTISDLIWDLFPWLVLP